MGLELLAVVIGLATFAPQLQYYAINIWEDNHGGECALTKACARESDHNLLVHAVWLMAARCGMALWVQRVASDDNIADEPSRGKNSALAEINAQWVSPELPSQIWHPDQWTGIALEFAANSSVA